MQRNIKAVMDEIIRSAEAQLYEQAPWIVNFVERTFPLYVDETDYDLPDDTLPGQIEAVGVRKIADGKVYRLEPGIRLGETNALGTAAGCPQRYNFIDQIIRIAPKADIAVYDVLVMWYRQVPNGLVNDNDRTVVDGEAIKALVTILAKEHFEMGDTDRARVDLGNYLRHKQSGQSDGAGFQMGGKQSLIGGPQARNRFGRRNATYGEDWHPW